ncbi:MAG: tetratricopeptide repeat protein [Ferruginibacter sp.]
MKNLMALFLLFACSSIQAQDLNNTEWIRLKATRKDGSRILDRSASGPGTLKYRFKKDSVVIFVNNQITGELAYSISDRMLSVGSFLKFRIDTLTDVILTLTESPLHELPGDKIDRYVFINGRMIFDYLYQTKQIHILGDSLIQCDELFCPTYRRGNIGSLLSQVLDIKHVDRTVYGSIILTQEGQVRSVLIDSMDNFPAHKIRGFADALKLTSGGWDMPSTPKPFLYKIDFVCRFSGAGSFSGETFIFGTKQSVQFSPPGLTAEERNEADSHFKKGDKLAKKGNYEMAVDEFRRCIGIDSLNIDAYYNLAFAELKLGKLKTACEVWNQLKNMGQKQGEDLFLENCK